VPFSSTIPINAALQDLRGTYRAVYTVTSVRYF
jgi:hypothetical protein